MTHIQGPWTAHGSHIAKEGRDYEFPIASVSSIHPEETAYANARLIAAAPDLLKVAQGALGYLLALPPRYRPDDHWLTPLRAAIGDATGEDPC